MVFATYHAYSAWKLALNSSSCFIVCLNSSVGVTRLVILKWKVPSTCPKPLPGTVMIPVFSTMAKQYIASTAIPFSAAAAFALSENCTYGNPYIAPWTELLVTFSMLSKVSFKIKALSLRPCAIVSLSCWYF